MALAILAFAADLPAQGNMVYYPPEKFSGVPAWVVAELNARGCSIPQALHFRKGPHNLIRGEFVLKGQADWAALCSKNGKSSIVLLSTNKEKCTQELPVTGDSAYVQQVSSNQQAFSRLISTATSKEITPYAMQDSPGFDHDGIIDEFAEKASSIIYCREGTWVELQAVD